jgi:hypothetical protein
LDVGLTVLLSLTAKRMPISGTTSTTKISTQFSYADNMIKNGFTVLRMLIYVAYFETTVQDVSQFIFYYFLWLTVSTGKRPIRDGSLMLVRFSLLRIVDSFSTIEELDHLSIQYQAEISHLFCLTTAALRRIVRASPLGSFFEDNVYFHPNVGVNGWNDLVGWYQGRNPEQPPLPPFPAQPQFWSHATRGSQIELWPPEFFNTWIDAIADGRVLSLDPSPGPIAGPSHLPNSSSDPVAGPSQLPDPYSCPPSPLSTTSSSSLTMGPVPPSQPMSSPPEDDDDDDPHYDNMYGDE